MLFKASCTRLTVTTWIEKCCCRWTKWGLERDEIATRAADLWNPTARSMEALNL
jgi:hypothetical protein